MYLRNCPSTFQVTQVAQPNGQPAFCYPAAHVLEEIQWKIQNLRSRSELWTIPLILRLAGSQRRPKPLDSSGRMLRKFIMQTRKTSIWNRMERMTPPSELGQKCSPILFDGRMQQMQKAFEVYKTYIDKNIKRKLKHNGSMLNFTIC